MSGNPPCSTAEDALCQAVIRAVETLGEPGELTDVSFGQFTDLSAGWHWTLTVTRHITSEHPSLGGSPAGRSTDSLKRRTSMIIESWKRDVARYRQNFTPREKS